MARILIVDDSTSLRLVLAAVLQDAGYEVEQASDGVEALHDLASTAPDLVLSDIHMPRLDGLALLHEARDVDPAPHWILMSGTLRRPAQFPVPFLVKPFNLDDLLDLIARLLAA